MFQFKQTHINFMSKRHLWMAMSVILVILSIVALATRGLNFGIDFTGGTVVEVHYDKVVPLSKVRESLHAHGFKDAQATNIGTAQDVMIRVAPKLHEDRSKIGDQVLSVLQASAGGQVVLRKVEFVGPVVGKELRQDGSLALLYTMIAILVYVAFRFEYRLAIGAVIASMHDIIVTLGVFAITQYEFNLTVLAALLALLGYSLNDTIVVYDRIRENFRRMRKGSPVEVVNTAVNQTLSRTVMTSLTVVLVLLSLFFLGGSVIHNFSVALLVGVVFGTYSSVYIASSLALLLGISKADLMPVKKGEVDDRP
ncbi:protein-export membrane protein SecF [Acidihalobacter yilgarnensis]|uniref:Protein-export membrane protein SecF n=1 Tax=Acidihalobacter yilgarnensis TaxID=2819280 RepID=A0A1D8IP09_9GAMM|nr:protein translocase subunit SecF [Acidihalobacter yilgarnensis]AOU98230.1 protein-export membrane protein SecF [Acidihalobacter yilgarnensis]